MQNKSILAALAAFALVAGSAPCHAETTNAVAKADKLELTAQQKTRYHNIHYNYGHRLIPEFVFKYSIHVRESIEGSDTEFPEQFGKFLVGLWNDLWGAEPPEPVGLNSEIIGVGIGTNDTDRVNGFLITFPEPPQSPDNYFAFVFVDKNMNLRYLTYEKSISFGGGNDNFAVLCGWNPNGSRANYGLSGGITRDEFLAVLRPFLTKESPPLAAWNPSGGEVEN